MRKIYLIRHAMPDMPPGERLCLGRTDVPLGVIGRMQGVLLASAMRNRQVTAVFCSDLSRSIQTASYLTESPVVLPELTEMGAGEWDGLPFSEIQNRWPEVYALRGKDPDYPIPGAEDPQMGQQRFLSGVREALARSQGDIAIVAHATVNQSLICHILGTDLRHSRQYRTGYTAITTLTEEAGKLSLLTLGEKPEVRLTPELCFELLRAAQTPEKVIDHCRAVACGAAALAEQIPLPLDRECILHGALLHDIARGYPNHADLGAYWLRELGYPEIGECIRCHHDLETEEIREEALVWLADKLPIAERFAQSLRKCTTSEALAAHERRFRTARVLQEKINAICGKDVVV